MHSWDGDYQSAAGVVNHEVLEAFKLYERTRISTVGKKKAVDNSIIGGSSADYDKADRLMPRYRILSITAVI